MKILVLMVIMTLMGATVWAQSASGLVDPLRPSHYQVQSPADPRHEREDLEQLRDQLRLTAILLAPDRAVAVINGRPLQVGQKIGDLRLIDIGPNQVVLQKGQQRLTLYRSVSDMQKAPTADDIMP